MAMTMTQKIIAAHCGWRWWPELAGIMEWKPRIYGCLTEWQLMAVADYPMFCRTLRQMIDSMTARLATHSMFGGNAMRRLQMCADCRVVDMVSATDEATIFDYSGREG